MSAPNPICPRCKLLPKNPNCGYCNPCNRRRAREQYKASHKHQGKGWQERGNAVKAPPTDWRQVIGEEKA